MSKKTIKINLEPVDGVQWQVDRLTAENNSPRQKAQSMEKVAHFLLNVKDDLTRTFYVEDCLKKFKWNKKLFMDYMNSARSVIPEIKPDDERLSNLPEGVDPMDFVKKGFYALNNGPGATGFYFASSNSAEAMSMSNFTFKLLFHVEGADDNKRLLEIDNGYEKKIIDIQSKSLISLEQFSAAVFEQGYYIFEGQKSHLMKLNKAYGKDVPTCKELKTLGWQGEGFFAYSNHIFSDKLIPMDDYGIAQHNGNNYFSPSCSKIYQNLRQDDDPYENDRYMILKPTTLSFKEWANLFLQVYGKDKGRLGISSVFVCLFKDLIYKVDNNCPHFYAYGPSRSGKSKFMESLSAVFFHKLNAFNLNSGTTFAFNNKMERFRNVPSVFNEFDDSVVRDEWFQAIKGAYDGEGRERGRTNKKSETQKVNSVLFLLGQYLSVKDDNSMLSRCVRAPFGAPPERTEKEMDLYFKLKKYEEEGINGLLLEILALRQYFEENYNPVFHEEFAELKDIIIKRNESFNERVVRNYCAFLTCTIMVKDKIDIPIDIKEYRLFIASEVVALSKLITNSDSLGLFWTTVMRLLDTQEITPNWNFKIKPKNEIMVTRKGKKEKIQFSKPKRLLFIRLGTIGQLYSEAAKRQGHHPLGIDTLKHYFEDMKYYVGESSSQKFWRHKGGDREVKNTNSTVFDYDMLEEQNIYLFSEIVKGSFTDKDEVEEQRDPVTGEIISPTKEGEAF